MKHSATSFDREKLEFLYQEPTKGKAKSKFFVPLKSAWQRLVNFLTTTNELQVWQSSDRHGNTWWNAYDPATGRSTKLSSEAEMRVWIEQRYYPLEATQK